MNRSPFHIYYRARELAGYATGENKLLPAFASCDIKIYPYQIAAAMFALRSSYLKGVVLADEGSLGKTYEALLIATQKWYEGKDKQLVILPTNLVKQWIQKIENGFTLPYLLIDSEETFQTATSFDQHSLVITTYDFAVSKADHIAQVAWDLVIFDEASILSKGYTGDHKTATALKGATYNAFKLLLTPTPITMSIMDIYGLLWFIDETIVPDDNWFYERYFRKPENYGELSEWVSKYCFRTLKSQVSDYVNFSQRLPFTVGYDLTSTEKELYTLVDRYLAIPQKVAYPKMDPYDLTLMFYHTLSSSAQAFCKMLEGAISRIGDSLEKDLLKEIQRVAGQIVVNGKMKRLFEVIRKAFKRLDSLITNLRKYGLNQLDWRSVMNDGSAIATQVLKGILYQNLDGVKNRGIVDMKDLFAGYPSFHGSGYTDRVAFFNNLTIKGFGTSFTIKHFQIASSYISRFNTNPIVNDINNLNPKIIDRGYTFRVVGNGNNPIPLMSIRVNANDGSDNLLKKIIFNSYD